ncbi:protein FLX-like 1 [Iris pallida]|uniref:Protein FLX-like 1 n=1 Tax=Iris pallida TaxID=29817 RepID=A0AAX6G4S0_IRIPA|nr:protein FLX-like 1 [Iris pallida]
MAGWNRMPPHHDLSPFGRGPPIPPVGMGLPPPAPHQHHHLLGEMGGPPPPLPHHPYPMGIPHRPAAAASVIEERMAVQQQEIQGMLVDNQRLAATHVALKQELAAASQELHRMSSAVAAMNADREAHLREVYEKSLKIEAELRTVELMRAELIQVRGDIQKLNAARQELTGQIQVLTQDLSRASADVQQAPTIKAEIETMKQELQRARQAIEFEKKGYAENYEQGQVMEKNLISMAREVEKLRAEVANAEKRARAAAAAGNQGAGFGGNYGNADPSYGGNPYPAGYGMNTVPGAADGATQYGTGSGSGHGSWGAYDVQRTHAHR